MENTNKKNNSGTTLKQENKSTDVSYDPLTRKPCTPSV